VAPASLRTGITACPVATAQVDMPSASAVELGKNAKYADIIADVNFVSFVMSGAWNEQALILAKKVGRRWRKPLSTFLLETATNRR